jgi:thiol-disulfide isomerase/thioredoxin
MKTLALAALLASSASAGEPVSDLGRVEATIKAYVAEQSRGGAWLLKLEGRDAPLQMTLRWINPKSLRPMGPDRFLALAVFVDRVTGAAFDADLDVSLGGWQPEVLNVRWLSKAERDAAILTADAQRRERELRASRTPARRAATAAKRAALAPGTPALPAASMPTVDGTDTVELASCPGAKCLTLYVAPWCPYCHAYTPAFLRLREMLKQRDVPLRVLVTADTESNLRHYAWSFGPDTMVDAEGLIKPPGFPQYCVSADGGEILAIGPVHKEDVDDPVKFIAKLGL